MKTQLNSFLLGYTYLIIAYSDGVDVSGGYLLPGKHHCTAQTFQNLNQYAILLYTSKTGNIARL